MSLRDRLCLAFVAAFIVAIYVFGVSVFVAASKELPPTPEVTERNEWGQKPSTLDRLCKTSILQWSKVCADIRLRND